MMKKLVLMAVLLAGVVAQGQVRVAEVTFDVKEEFGSNELVLNGAGIREKLWIDLYAAGLYLSEKSKDPIAIINADKPMAIRLHILSKLITSDKMVEAVTEGFENATGGKTEPIASEIDQILSFFKEDIHKGDVFELVYLPSKGVIASKNGVQKGVIKGKDFKKALFGIWLSNRPADDDLKENLLSAD